MEVLHKNKTLSIEKADSNLKLQVSNTVHMQYR